MASSNFTCFLLCILYLVSNSIFYSNADSPTSPSSSSSSSNDTVCDLTPYPSFCKSNAPPKGQGNFRYYGNFFARKSLKSSTKFLSLLSNLLKSPSRFSQSTILALHDCKLLTELNNDFFSNTIKTINTSSTLIPSDAENLLTLLSATITNIDTCLESLQDATSSTPDNDLLTHISNGTKFHSISLATFKHGWAKNVNTKTEERVLMQRNSFAWEQRLYERLIKRGRKLLQVIPDNVVVNQKVVVNPDGSGDFMTINYAVNAAPNNTAAGNGYFVIYVVAGVYEEYVSIPKNKQYMMMIGDGINQTVITGNRSVVDGWTTFNSATFVVVAQGFVAINITFRNTAGAIKHQAVAVRNGADLSAFYFCSFEGYQDTLYTHSLRQFYRNCDIYGTVDFIFGNAVVVFQNCNLFPKLPLQGQFNAITAQGRTDINQNTGTSIHNCTITAASDLAAGGGTTKTYLGRPWKQYSRTVYMQSFMDSLINPAGWKEWSGDFALDTLYYAEFNNQGPGSDTSNRVTWPGYHVINATDATSYTVSNFIFGAAWLPPTGVPFFPDLF